MSECDIACFPIKSDLCLLKVADNATTTEKEETSNTITGDLI